MTTNKMRGLEKVVYEVLSNNKSTRKNDFLLVDEVFKIVSPEVSHLGFETVLIHHKELKLPPFESVTRARRKLQNKYPELLDEDMAKLREQQQENYINYALGD